MMRSEQFDSTVAEKGYPNLWPASLLDQLMPWVWAAEHSNQKLAA
jgi:hypothetical protein